MTDKGTDKGQRKGTQRVCGDNQSNSKRAKRDLPPCEPLTSRDRSSDRDHREDPKSAFCAQMGSELICSICKEYFVHAVTLNCSHTFCELCIAEWRDRRNECPICRHHIVNQTPQRVLDNVVDSFITHTKPSLAEQRKRLVEKRKKDMEKKNRRRNSRAPRGFGVPMPPMPDALFPGLSNQFNQHIREPRQRIREVRQRIREVRQRNREPMQRHREAMQRHREAMQRHRETMQRHREATRRLRNLGHSDSD